MNRKFRWVTCTLFVMLGILLVACSNTKSHAQAERPEISYKNAVVSYLGPEGTYSQEACIHFFEREGSYIPYKTVNDTVEALLAGKSDYAVIPQENTIGGAVIDYVDTLISQKDVSVAGEVELPIRQNLLGMEGAALADIRTVYSHKQGIIQGANWMKNNLPQAEVIEVSSTAEGAKMVSEAQDPTVAAIASAACVDVYHLEMLAESIQENDSNVTRFYVLSKETAQTEPADRMVFIASGNAEGLPKLLAQMDKAHMTLITIHDRPRKTELGEYDYVIECAGASYDAYCKLEKNSGFTFRYLGSFDVIK